MDGILLVDKPAGISSFAAVAKVRKILADGQASAIRKIKIGHTGTLDPAATGLLILALGKYTKRAGEFSKLDKTYEAEITLGAVSTTGDIEGEITQKSSKKPAEKEINDILSQFIGKIQQIPHKYSAVKVGGRRAYKLARAGEEVKLEPREVTIFELKIDDYTYPVLKITTKVSSGTYIRSLAEDIGEKLGTGAYLSALRRTKIGEFTISQAKTLDSLGFKSLRHSLLTNV